MSPKQSILDIENVASTIRTALPRESIFFLNPNDIRESAQPNRDPASYLTDAFYQLQESILHEGGNVEPAKARIVRKVDGSELETPFLEIVFGNRRLHACRHHGLLLRVIVVEDMSDEEALSERLAENHGRAEFSPVELGRICVFALSKGFAKTQKALAIKYGRDESDVSKAVAIANLPEEILAAFDSPGDLQYRHAKPLREAVERDLASVLEAAAELERYVGPKKPAMVVARLIRRADEPVGQSNPSKIKALEVNGIEIGQLATAANGCVTIKISHKFDEDVSGQLERHVLAFVGKHLKVKPKDKGQSAIGGPQ